MDAAELRALQAPIKDRYKSEPSAAVITLKARGSIENEGIACKVETGRALSVAGLHPATGGSGLELCSGDMLLEALNQGARHLDRNMQVISQLQQAPDHPVHPAIPETDYLKGFIARVLLAQ